MKKSYFIFFLIFCTACNSTENKDNSSSDSVTVGQAPITDSSLVVTEKDSTGTEHTLLEINKAVLTSLKNRDYSAFETYIHPSLGLHFSPYAQVNTREDKLISKSDFATAVKSTQKMLWGQYDGTGDPIELTVKEYFAKFVYDVDFLNAEKVNVNASASTGNIINNIDTAYPAADYVENYFAGFDPEFQGMDWRALRLVFKKQGDQYFLIGLVHDQWTT